MHLAALDAANADPSQIGRIVERRDQHLERTRLGRLRRWNRSENRVKQRRQRRSWLVELQRRRAQTTRRIKERAVELLRRRLQVHQELEYLVVHAQWLGIGPVDLV